MVYVIIGLLALIAAEAAAALLLAVKRTGDGAGERDGAGEARAPGGEEFEKRWQEGMSAMMGYDLMAARRAVRSDGEDER